MNCNKNHTKIAVKPYVVEVFLGNYFEPNRGPFWLQTGNVDPIIATIVNNQYFLNSTSRILKDCVL